MDGPSVVVSPDRLGDLLEAARAAGRVGLDTEFLRERTYRSRLCLLQLATPEDLQIIDPTDGLDLSPVAGLISDRNVEVVVHAGKQDLELFHERFGVVPSKVFDVQVAAGFVGLGASLPYGRLVELVLEVRLSKGESYTDWCRRPLTAAQLRYAADDVRYLLDAAAALQSRLEERGRAEWAEEEMSSLCRPEAYEIDLDEVWRRVSGRGSLPDAKLPVLRELARWREETAIRRDIPRGWVIKDPTLIEIARRTPATVERLKQVRGLSEREAQRSGRILLEAIERGKRSPPIREPRPPPRLAQARARLLAGVADAVVRARSEKAGLAPELVTTRGELESLLAARLARPAAFDGLSYRLLKGWRRDLAGEAILALADGRIAVRSSERPPYIEEVRMSDTHEEGFEH